MGNTWRTYKGEQARNIVSAFHILLQGDLLTKDEAERARSLQRRLAGAASRYDEEFTSIEVSGKEDELLQHVEGSLWK